jgi:hypothetical protein
MRSKGRLTPLILAVLLLAAAIPVVASDHAEASNNNDDRATDIGDSYMFLDPNDNTRVVMILTFNGFIVPSENTNLFIFSPTARYNFDIENTGDAVIDQSYRVTFSPKTAASDPQVATIALPDGHTFTAQVTPSSHTTAAPASDPVLTTDPASGVTFYAGINDDPFFFDIPAFGRLTASIRAGSPDLTTLSRGRDSFAGYNIQTIALSVPAAQLRGSAGNVVGLSVTAQRRLLQFVGADGKLSGSGRWVNLDRFGNPAVNTVVIPFSRKNEYNFASTSDDAAGKFATDIVASLTALGTNAATINALAGIVVSRGDILRLDTSIANTGAGGGNNAGVGFPNGRRLADDVIDTLLTLVANGTTLGDSVPANDVAFRSSFPFVAPPHQPLATGATDLTQN